jgi:Glycosyltransferase like family
MLAFGSAITKRDVYDRCCGPGIARVAEPDSVVLDNPSSGSIFRSYNALMDEVAGREDLEALVLLHQDTELADSGFCAKVRRVLADPQVGVIGVVGALGVRSIAWWEGSVTWASFSHRYTEFGGGEFPALAWDDTKLPPYAQTGEVDSVDGFMLVLSPWVVRNVRFDEELGGLLHGYDFDFCLQVRERGKTIRTENIKAVHHHSLELASDLDDWAAAYIRVIEKWEGRMPGIGEGGGDWRQRARRAEAEGAAARAQAIAIQMQMEARTAEHERGLGEMLASTSWKVTAPLRGVTRLLRIRGARG